MLFCFCLVRNGRAGGVSQWYKQAALFSTSSSPQKTTNPHNFCYLENLFGASHSQTMGGTLLDIYFRGYVPMMTLTVVRASLPRLSTPALQKAASHMSWAVKISGTTASPSSTGVTPHLHQHSLLQAQTGHSTDLAQLLFFVFFVVLGFELKASHLQGRGFTT
jgi:hypothetical protein